MQLTASLFFSVASSIFSLLDGQRSVASATLGKPPECRCRAVASLGTVGGRAAAWAAASYNFPTVLLLLSLSCPGGAAAASKRLNFWMRSTTFWAVWVCGSSETNEGMGRGGLGVGVSAKWGLYRE